MLAAWVQAVQSRDPEAVLRWYAPDATLLGTLSPVIRQGHAAIREYFEHLLDADALEITVTEEHTRSYENLVILSGLYAFNRKKGHQEDFLSARFTFVWEKREGEWLIVEHHSSLVPSPAAS